MNIDYINETLIKCNTYIDNILMPIIKSCNEELEGNIFDKHPIKGDIFLPKRQNIVIASCQNINTALEIGFNSGFSALLILLSNPNIQLTCVDIAIHKYTIPCFQQLNKDFGDRINLLVGDSRNIVSRINKTYDLIHIDGGHTYNIAENDIKNTNKLLNNNAIIIMDDVEMSNNNHVLGNLWKKYVSIFNYKEPIFDIIHNNYQDIKINNIIIPKNNIPSISMKFT